MKWEDHAGKTGTGSERHTTTENTFHNGRRGDETGSGGDSDGGEKTQSQYEHKPRQTCN